MVHYLLRFVLLFTSDAFGSSVRRLKALRLDMGRSFSSSVTVKERCAFQLFLNSPLSGPCLTCTCCGYYCCLHRSAQLDIRSCLYNDILKEEEAGSLLECCCCSQDSVWCVIAACTHCFNIHSSPQEGLLRSGGWYEGDRNKCACH